MLRIALAAVIFIHGLIHLMGFVNEWKLAEVKGLEAGTLVPLSPAMAKFTGGLWLLATLCFISAGMLFLLKREVWWVPAFTGVLLSQALVVLYWPSAKWGTIANVIILLAAIIAFATWQFNRNAAATANQLLEKTRSEKQEVVTATMLHHLPQPVQLWLRNSGIVGREAIRSVRLKQKGWMRTKPDQKKWIATAAEQYITITEPAFAWKVKMNMLPFVPVIGLDLFSNGKGHMNIKLLSLVNVVNDGGDKIDQGALQRYLAEICWAPSAALQPYIKWEAVDAYAAKATLTYNGTSGSVIFYFNDKGDMIYCIADRYQGGGKNATLEKWEVRTTETGVRDGIRVPVKSEVTWKLKTGNFTWYKLEIPELQYNVPQLYQSM
jgi:hypothetical protein